MSTFGPLGAAAAMLSVGAAGPTKVGGASGTPRSDCQSLATRPTAADTTRRMNSATTTSETTPTRSLRKRRAAAVHTPADRRVGAAAGIGAFITALIVE